MRRAGEVVRAAQGKLVVRVPDPGGNGDEDGNGGAGEADHVPIGTELVDETLREVGRVVDVFGPAARPYLAVVPAEAVRPADRLGDRLYARD